MPLTLSQSATAVAPFCKASFLGVGGTAPYVYSVEAGGAGGTINASTGLYTGPATASSSPSTSYDTIKVTDAASNTATAQILVGTPLLLLCEILQRQLGLSTGRVYLWDQKIMQPTDSGLYVAVSVANCKPFGNVNRPVATLAGQDAEQFIAMSALVDIDVISRGPSARDRKEEVLIALGSTYSQQQQNANSFYVALLPTGFVDLSGVDGAAIPYRFKISVRMQYAYAKTQANQYFDDFDSVEVVTDP